MLYQFTVHLNETDIDHEGDDRLAATCDDATHISSAGVSQLQFDRESRSLQEAIASAVRDIQSAGFTVAQVQIDAEAALKL